MVQMQGNQHFLLKLWILAKRIVSILISGNLLDISFHVSCTGTQAASDSVRLHNCTVTAGSTGLAGRASWFFFHSHFGFSLGSQCSWFIILTASGQPSAAKPQLTFKIQLKLQSQLYTWRSAKWECICVMIQNMQNMDSDMSVFCNESAY